MISAREKGDKAEELAVGYLEHKGYQILHRNWYYSHYELDIVARTSDTLVFIEVKSLFSNSLQEPYRSVNRNKQKMIVAAANAYIRKFNLDDEVRFDVISIVLGKHQPIIDHIENAFYPRCNEY